jgi:hypothetical protein
LILIHVETLTTRRFWTVNSRRIKLEFGVSLWAR